MIELCSDLPPKQPSGPSWADRPGLDVLGIAPHEVAEGTFVRDLTYPVYRTDLNAQGKTYIKYNSMYACVRIEYGLEG